MSRNTKSVLMVLGSVLAIGASAFWIYHFEFKTPQHNVALHQRIGAIMAEQTAKLAGNRGRILLITIPTSGEPELQTQLDEFRRTLSKLGEYKIKEEELDPKNQPKYGLGSGLSGRRFVRAINNNRADVVVSFIGTPELSDEEIGGLKRRPKFIAETRSPDDLPNLFEKKLLHVAVVSRFVFPAPGPIKPSTTQEWFDKRYQIVTAHELKLLANEPD